MKEDQSKKSTTLRSFRMHLETAEKLDQVVDYVNGKLNIKVSKNSIVELIIKEAVKDGGKKILSLINNS